MLNRQYAKDGLTNLKYVAIDIKIKDDAINTSICGLFLGYKTLTFDTNEDIEINNLFVWIYSKKCVYLYSLRYYEILSIEISLDDGNKTIQFTNFNNKQEEAVKSILEIVEALKEQDKIQPNGLVDIYKYESLPFNLKDDLGSSSEIVALTDDNITHNQRSVTSLYKNRNAHSYTPPQTYYSKEIKTFFIERTSKYSIEEAVKKMGEKIEKIKNGTYCVPKLKKTLEGNVKKDDEKDDDEDHTANNENFYGYGAYG